MTIAEIHVSLVNRLVAEQFPHWSKLPIEPVLPGGWDNRTFRLGTNMSVRFPSAPEYASQVEKEHHWLPRLAPLLPLAIPEPLAMGRPAAGYPWQWSVYRWLEGDTATHRNVEDWCRLARDLAAFLCALHRIDITGGPPPGTHNFFRGGPLAVYDSEVRTAATELADEIDRDRVHTVWETALRAVPPERPVWVHGDISADNLLIRDGRLCAVIDFGCTGVGDPACDLAIAWTLFEDRSRDALRQALPLDDATWERGRAWALWKALITLAEYRNSDALRTKRARRVIQATLADRAG